MTRRMQREEEDRLVREAEEAGLSLCRDEECTSPRRLSGECPCGKDDDLAAAASEWLWPA